MRGLTWTLSVWALVLPLLGWLGLFGRGDGRRFRLSRPELAIIAVLLGTHSLVAGSRAEDILDDPVVFERVIRGALSGLGLVLVLWGLRVALPRLRSGHWPALTVLTGYVGVAFLSFLYSAAPIVTLGKVFELSAGLAIAWAIAGSKTAKQDLADAVRLVVFLEGAIISVAVVGFFALPDVFTAMNDSRPGFLFERVMSSPSAHSNTLSAGGALLAAYSLAAFFRASERSQKALWMTWAVVGTVGMILSSGRQGLVIWLAAVAVLLWTQRRSLFVFVVAPLTALVLAANWEVVWDAVTRNQSSASLATLSSRLVFWSAAIESWQIHPLTGYGYGVGGRFVVLPGISRAASLHSGYMEALVGVGLIGALLLLVVVVRVGMWAVSQLRRGADSSSAILFIPLTLHTAVSLGFGGWLNADFLLFAFLAANADIAFRESRRMKRSLEPVKQDGQDNSTLAVP